MWWALAPASCQSDSSPLRDHNVAVPGYGGTPGPPDGGNLTIDPGWIGALAVLVFVVVSVVGTLLTKEHDVRALPYAGHPTQLLSAVQGVSKFLSKRVFPLQWFINLSKAESRDTVVDRYVLGWTLALLIAVVVTVALQHFMPTAGAWAATFVAWLAAYRTIDIVVSRIYILTTFTGVHPFELNQARRSMILSIIDVAQVVTAFAFMYQGWVSDQWSPQHQLLGFGYVSMRVLFTLGPAQDPSAALGAGARALIGAEILAGLVVIALGVASYLSALRDRSADFRRDPPLW